MHKHIALLVLVALVIFGCSRDETPPPTTAPLEKQVTDLTGELRKTMVTHEATIDDFDQAVQTMSGDLPPNSAVTDYDVYSVTFVWGEFPPQPNPTLPATDWSGNLGIENGDGIVNVIHEIDFEAGQDSVIAHDAVHFAMWASQTNGDLDGLSFLVFIQRPTTNDTSPTLHFHTDPFDLVLNREQLGHYGALYSVSNTQIVAVLSRQIWPNNCAGGFITGEWNKPTIFADSGTFSANWQSFNGEPVATMAGTYWTTEDGTRKFHAYLSHPLLTVVIGEAQGEWLYDDPRMCPMCGTGHGRFHGSYEIYENGTTPQQLGKLWGEFGDYSLDIDALVLPMSGVWRADCLTTPHDDGVGSSN